MPQPTPEQKWQKCLDILQINTKPNTFDTLFAPIVFHSLDAGTGQMVLGVQSHYICETLEQPEFKHLLYSVLWKVYKDERVRITYRILTDSTTNATQDVATLRGSTGMGHINQRTKKVSAPAENELASRLNENYTFENFIEGSGNKLLRSVGLSIAENQKQLTFNPLFIYGPPGVGKTHLANAIGIRFKRITPASRVLYVSANEFKEQYMRATQQNQITGFVEFYQTIDVLILDDVQDLAGLGATQKAFFHIFNHLKMNGKRIIMTSDREPASIPGLEDRMLTRFKWGLVAEIEKPDEALCHKILQYKVRQDNLAVSDEVIDFIARNVNNSIRELEGVLAGLQAHALAFNRDIDMSIVQRVVHHTTNHQRRVITLEQILEHTCTYYNVPLEEVMAKGRKANVVLVRQLTMYLADKLTQMTATKIGLHIGGRNHATVLHALKQMRDRIATDKALARQVQEVETLLRSPREAGR